MDHLWPQILHHNKCDIKSSNTVGYFTPQQKFDHIWAHELLANKSCDNYNIPIELRCNQISQKKAPVKEEEEIEQLPYRGPNTNILPLDQQLAFIQQDVEIRQKLANDFVNRNFPWYIQRPSYHYNFDITSELKLQFKNPFEYEILRNIQRCQCHLMIIDVAPAVPLRNLERWLKFSPYVAIVTVFHDKELYRKVKNFNCAYQPVLMEENPDLTWQEELNRSLEMGLNKAKELFLLEDDGKTFVFVFSLNRGICVCNKFKVLRKL